jgi:hypothetical protein
LLGADISLQSMSEVVVYFAAFKNRKTWYLTFFLLDFDRSNATVSSTVHLWA